MNAVSLLGVLPSLCSEKENDRASCMDHPEILSYFNPHNDLSFLEGKKGRDNIETERGVGGGTNRISERHHPGSRRGAIYN